MKLAPVPQNLPEWFALKADMVPVPLAHTHICFMLSKAILDAFELNVFETLKDESKNLEKASADLGLDVRALKSLLNVLISTGYIKYSGRQYSLTKHARKWCLKESSHSLYDQQVFNNLCWDWMKHFPEFMKTGKGLQFHQTFNEREWDLYQKGMLSVAAGTAKAAVKMAPVLNNPQKMLDVGGSHGLYSIGFCKKYPGLQSTIIDLPQAVEKAESLLRSQYDGNNISYLKGNALTDNFGNDTYDLIFISSLMHHFSAEENYSLAVKSERALKKNGYLVIQEFIRPETSNNMEMVGTVLDLFFNLSSASGNWSKAELVDFQEKAGLKFKKMNKFLTVPGYAQIVAQKSQA